MMAAEAGAEEGGSVTSAGMVRAVGGAESEHYPTLCRGKELGPQGSFLVGSGGDAPGAGGPALCSALGFLSLGSGPAPLVSGGGGAVTTTGQGQEMSGGLLPPPEPSTVAFPPPPQPPSLAGGLGTVDEGDSLDGPEYEEEEVAIPLNAPPTNQYFGSHCSCKEEEAVHSQQWTANVGRCEHYSFRRKGRPQGSITGARSSQDRSHHRREKTPQQTF
ncbi:uncharacterized protein LOC141735439 isoform X3 [Larus michahellis]|uniref:uncharacterized protein LOC141735439 isoform X3 n=1 Tax=Larus michahellis TaxID=119627 RepID=UPI003D9AE665